ncbi:GntR family transcriptional regulator [Solihabitans fulvus]|uniref:GntR family transcriptional regulator n=1 Tax=Solihabitans fulvus TaxID=1892852 RepID=A0A5B2WRX9_9PSEU|nr:GntR family transcriptional regulator [Solihabitans fulvus]KAA2252717.1 GntR family transcriptional regulator [Solihabitans fulvus]
MDEVPGLRSAQRRGLAEEAADRIREAIFDGAFPPGAPLREVELAAALRVSRGSVREGLTRLDREGLVESEWHRGCRVRTLSAADADELHTLRAALDELAMRTAAARATEADLAGLGDLVAGLERARDLDAPTADLIALDMRFHDGVYRVTGHRRLGEAWAAIRSQIYLFLLIRTRGAEDYRDLVVEEHRDLVEALRSGDQDRAARLGTEHVHGGYRRLLDGLGADVD